MRFLKDHRLGALRKKLVLLYVLNLCDIAFTLLLLSTGGFREVNPIMAAALQNGAAVAAVKLLLPGAVLVWLYTALLRSDLRQKKLCNQVVNVMLLGYITVNAAHLGWTARLIL